MAKGFQSGTQVGVLAGVSTRFKSGHKNNLSHGHSSKHYKSPTYISWRSMINRCKHPSVNGYKYYGGRGIQVCSSWLESFSNFLRDLGDRPIGMTLDRIDPDGNYEPNNCRWATAKQQTANQRKR